MARSWWRPAGSIMAVAGLACLPFVLDDWTLTNVSRIMGLALLAVSVSLLTGTAGLPTLGQVAPFGIGAYLAVNLAEAGFVSGPGQLLAAGLLAAAFSAVVGLVVIRTRGATFLMVTLAVGMLIETAAGQWTSITGGTDGTSRVPPAEPLPGLAPLIDEWNIYWYCLAVTVVVVGLVLWALRSWPGTLIRGCRDHETRMRASGHRVGGYLLAVYVAAGAIAGVGGALLVTGRRYFSPEDVNLNMSATVMLGIVIGGTASIPGALIGTAAVVLVDDWFTAWQPGQGPLLLGLMFILAVYLLPRGIAGLWGSDGPGVLDLLRRGRARPDGSVPDPADTAVVGATSEQGSR